MDIFLLQIAIVFVPGLIWARLDTRYGMRTRPSQTEFLIITLIYGLIAYAATYLVYAAVGWPFSPTAISSSDKETLFVKDLADETLVSIPIALALAIGWLYAVTNKWTARCLQAIGATRTYGDEDVWDFTFNANSLSARYVHFRDIDHDLTYAGWVRTFSQSGELRELVLEDVDVYTLRGGEQLYRVPHLYLARNKENILIEFPYSSGGGASK